MPPGLLWQQVLARTATALQSGALQSIATDCTWIEQSGAKFMVRVLANLARKDAASTPQNLAPTPNPPRGKDFNPFLPYEPDLYVTDISPTHIALLNKFNVVDHHLLLITRAFESQDNWLTAADCEALVLSLTAIDGLVFYNGGKAAGASQRHKHLQVIPLPLAPVGPRLPMEPLLQTATFSAGITGIGHCTALPFVHAIAHLPPGLFQSQTAAAQTAATNIVLDTYHTLLTAIGFPSSRETGAYNLLVTRDWMLMVRRAQESFDHIAINSLGFAGSFFVRNSEELQRLRHHGPLFVLSQVSLPPALVGDSTAHAQ